MSLRIKTAEWINEAHPTARPPLVSKSRANRGFKHDVCGNLLCSITLDWSDERWVITIGVSPFYAHLHVRIRNGIRNFDPAIDLTASTARILYAGYEGNPDDLAEGYLMSSLLVQVCRRCTEHSAG